jgi:hypothetical protein
MGAKPGDVIIIGSKQISSLGSNGKTDDEVEDWERLYLGAISVRQSYRTGEYGDWYQD